MGMARITKAITANQNFSENSLQQKLFNHQGIGVLLTALTAFAAMANPASAYDRFPASVKSSTVQTSEATAEAPWYAKSPGDIALYYNGLFYGPAIENPTSFQPSPRGEPDPDRPLLLKNYMTAGYYFTESIHVSGTAHWTYQPVLGHEVDWGDPFVRFAHNNLLTGDKYNLYADFRILFPVTMPSRLTDQLTSIQSFQVFNYMVGSTNLTLGTVTALKANIFGDQGIGDDLELYFGPNLSYAVTPAFAFTLLYEMGTSHTLYAEPFEFKNDGTDLQPGFSWDVTQRVNVSPYLNLFIGDQLSLGSTSFGMTMTVGLL